MLSPNTVHILPERFSRSTTSPTSMLLCLSQLLARHMVWIRLLQSLYIHEVEISGSINIYDRMGSSVLMLGAGPTGLVLAQLLRQNGGCHVVVAAPEGLKMELAKSVSHDQKQPLR